MSRDLTLERLRGESTEKLVRYLTGRQEILLRPCRAIDPQDEASTNDWLVLSEVVRRLAAPKDELEP